VTVTNKIICLGGTGQMLLHYYLQLYMIGIVETPFQAVVIDTDEIIPSLEATAAFLDLLGPEIGSVPSIRTIKLTASGAGSAFELLTGINTDQAPPLVPAHAFFDSETLGMDLTNGLFARPALSSVVSLEDVEERVIMPEDGATVVVAGSVIGGTGGGLIEPVVDLLRRYLDVNSVSAKIRAVLFGEYFEPDPGRIELRRLQSNQVLVLRTAKEALRELHSFSIVGGPGETKIAQLPDKNNEHIVWPDSDAHPFWTGVTHLHYLLTDQIMPLNRDFRQREVTTFPTQLELKRCRQRLSDATHVVEALIARNVVGRMNSEPWLRHVWGEQLTQLVSHFWRISAKVAGEWDRASDFPVALQHALEVLWRGDSQKRGVSTVFPSVNARHTVKPRSFRRIQWPTIDRAAPWNRNAYDAGITAATRCAATLTYSAMRKGN
jgi:hypothetical protein